MSENKKKITSKEDKEGMKLFGLFLLLIAESDEARKAAQDFLDEVDEIECGEKDAP